VEILAEPETRSVSLRVLGWGGGGEEGGGWEKGWGKDTWISFHWVHVCGTGHSEPLTHFTLYSLANYSNHLSLFLPN